MAEMDLKSSVRKRKRVRFMLRIRLKLYYFCNLLELREKSGKNLVKKEKKG